MFARQTTLTAEQRVNKAVIAIMHNPKYVALAGVLMVGERSVCETTPTACTNGRDEKYGRAFVGSLTDAELRFLILHESYHKLYKHLDTWKHLYKVDAQLANQACDYVINIKITDDNRDGFAVMPKGGCLDTKYRDWDSAKVFQDLQQQPQPQQQPLDEHDWEDAQAMDDEESKALAREIDEAIRQGAMAAGKTGATVDRDIQALLQPKVDWREQLRQFVSAQCEGADYDTWDRPERRFIGEDILMPSSESQSLNELVVGVDTSGSIGDHELAAFFAELVSVCSIAKPSKLRLLYWGHKVVGDEVYQQDELDSVLNQTRPKGGGGTDPSCVSDYMRDNKIKPQALIMLTDGYIFGDNWGTYSCPVMWAITEANTKAPVGISINIGD